MATQEWCCDFNSQQKGLPCLSAEQSEQGSRNELKYIYPWIPYQKEMLLFPNATNDWINLDLFTHTISVKSASCLQELLSCNTPVKLNPKRAGGQNPLPLRHFLLYLCRLLFFHAETSWLFSFKPCTRFKTIFIKIGPRVMTRRCVIARWVQQKLIFHWNYTQIVFFVFFVFQDTLPLCFILFI